MIQAVTAAVSRSSRFLPCRRQDSAAVSIRSTKRLPAELWLPKFTRRRRTAGRRALSELLFVGYPLDTEG